MTRKSFRISLPGGPRRSIPAGDTTGSDWRSIMALLFLPELVDESARVDLLDEGEVPELLGPGVLGLGNLGGGDVDVLLQGLRRRHSVLQPVLLEEVVGAAQDGG